MSMSIPIKNEEKVTLREAVRAKYNELRKGRDHFQEIDKEGNTFRPHYQGLVELVEQFLKEKSKEIPGNERDLFNSSYAAPKGGFFVKLFEKVNQPIKCKKAYLNGCYLFAYGKSRDEKLKNTSNHKIDLDAEIEVDYSVRAARKEDIQRIRSIAEIVYEGIDIIPYRTMKYWYDKNPCSFHVVINGDGIVVGNIDILPLKDEPLQEFLSGKKIEAEFTEDDLWGMDEKEKIKYLYIESFVNLAGRSAVMQLLKAVPSIIDKFGCEVRSIDKLYCISASEQGQRLIKKLGFKLRSEGKDRRDEHDVFEANVSDVLRSLDKLFSDHSPDTDFKRKLIKQLDQIDRPSL